MKTSTDKHTPNTHTRPHVLIHRFAVALVKHIRNKTHTGGGSRDDLKGGIIGGGEGGFFLKQKGGGGDFSPFATMRKECSETPF